MRITLKRREMLCGAPADARNRPAQFALCHATSCPRCNLRNLQSDPPDRPDLRKWELKRAAGMLCSLAMLNETLFRVPRQEGLQLLQRRGERGARELTSWRVCLSAGRSATHVV